MSSGRVRRVSKLTAEEAEVLVYVTVRANQNVRGARALVGGEDHLMPLLFRSLILAANLDGIIHVAESDAKEVVAVAVWFPPGRSLYDSEEQRNLGFNEFMETVEEKTRKWWTDTYSPMASSWTKTWLPKPPADCWWLYSIATDPNHQRKGYATELLHYAIQEFTGPSLLAFVTSAEETARFYESVGFPIRSRMVPDMPTRVGDVPSIGHYRKGVLE